MAMLFAASLHVMMGPGGMASFGHAAWFGIGAYAAALAAKGLVLPMPAGLLLAPVLAAGWRRWGSGGSWCGCRASIWPC